MQTLRFNVGKMRAAAGGGFSTATDVADYLVRHGVPFREAHEVVGVVVNYCETNNKELMDLSLDEWQTLVNTSMTSAFRCDGRQQCSRAQKLRRHRTRAVRKQLRRAQELLNQNL
jgi:argininosuccinate lyase